MQAVEPRALVASSIAAPHVAHDREQRRRLPAAVAAKQPDHFALPRRHTRYHGARGCPRSTQWTFAVRAWSGPLSPARPPSQVCGCPDNLLHRLRFAKSPRAYRSQAAPVMPDRNAVWQRKYHLHVVLYRRSGQRPRHRPSRTPPFRRLPPATCPPSARRAAAAPARWPARSRLPPAAVRRRRGCAPARADGSARPT